MSQNSEKAKVIAIQSFIAIIFVLIGILVSAQVRSIPTRVTNPIAPYANLKETKEELYAEQASLKTEIKRLQEEIEVAQRDTEKSTLTSDQIGELNYQKAMAGLMKLNGQGIIITLDDSKKESGEDAIIHAADLRDIINLLWISGAEGISLNGQRIVLNTAIDCIVNTVLVNNVRLSTPFSVEAVGDSVKLYDRVSDPNMLFDLHKRSKDKGIKFEVEKNFDITLPVFNGSLESGV